MEREQAIKLIRTIIEVGTTRKTGGVSGPASGRVHLSEAVMRAFIAVAEHPEDPFRPIALQTLTEIRANPPLQSPATKTLINNSCTQSSWTLISSLALGG